MAFKVVVLTAAFGAVISSARTLSSEDSRVDGPVEKVVSLLEDMKAQVEKDLADDQAAQAKLSCWCEANLKEKGAAVKAAEAKIAELDAFIQEAAGTEGVLKTEIGALEDGIVEDQDALDKATAVRDQENAEFEAEAADSKEAIATLEKALEVFSKLGLLQHSGDALNKARPLLMQLKATAAAFHPSGPLGERFQSVMQQDLWDVMGALDATGAPRAFMPRKAMSALAAGQPTGAAAGAQSYNTQSGQIVGILAQLKEDFEKSLATAEKAEADSASQFAALTASKESEITVAKEQKASKEKALADLLMRAAQAKSDIEATTNALTADQQFLLEASKNCKTSEGEFADRSKVRNQEIQAIGETIAILRSDDSRDLFGKTMSFIQTRSSHANHHVAANTVVRSAMQRIMKVARKHKNWSLASLAVNVRLDSFEKVKEMMDKMVAELKAQQKAESEKLELCKKEIDGTEDTVKVKNNEKEDLQATELKLDNSIATLEADIETLKEDVASTQSSLKQAGEERKAANKVFQQSVADQRAAIQILNKALARLKKFYTPDSLAQVRQTPGAPVEPAPASGKDYEKSAGAGGVMQMMQMIIAEASTEEQKIVAEEQHDQEMYAKLASDITATIEANMASIAEKTEAMEAAKGDKSETEGALLANSDELTKLDGVLKALHVDCDFLLQYYDVRQKARAEEMDAIAEAKAILSGSDFGAEE